MGEVGQLFVSVYADTSRFAAGMAQVKSGSAAAAAGMNTVSSSAGGLLSRLAQFGVASYGIQTVVGAVRGLVGEMERLADASIQAGVAQTRLETAMKNVGAAADGAAVRGMQSYIASASEASGFTRTELSGAMSFLVMTTGSVEEAQKKLTIAMDASRLTGYGLTMTSRLLGRANADNYMMLQRLGVPVREIKKELGGSGGMASAAEIAAFEMISLSEAQGIVARGGRAYDDILKQMGRSTGKAADDTAGYAEALSHLGEDVKGTSAAMMAQNPMLRLAQQTDELKLSLGSMLMPLRKFTVELGVNMVRGLREGIADPHKLQAVKWFGQAIAGGTKVLAAFAGEGLKGAETQFKASFGVEMPKSVSSFMELLGGLKDKMVSFAEFLGVGMGDNGSIIGPDAVERNKKGQKSLGDAFKDFARSAAVDLGGALDAIGSKVDSTTGKTKAFGTSLEDIAAGATTLAAAGSIVKLVGGFLAFAGAIAVVVAVGAAVRDLFGFFDDKSPDLGDQFQNLAVAMGAVGLALVAIGVVAGATVLGTLALLAAPIALAAGALASVGSVIVLIAENWDKFVYAWKTGLLDNVLLIGGFKRAIDGIGEAFLVAKIVIEGAILSIAGQINLIIGLYNGFARIVGLPTVPTIDTGPLEAQLKADQKKIEDDVWALRASLDTSGLDATLNAWINSNASIVFRTSEHANGGGSSGGGTPPSSGGSSDRLANLDDIYARFGALHGGAMIDMNKAQQILGMGLMWSQIQQTIIDGLGNVVSASGATTAGVGDAMTSFASSVGGLGGFTGRPPGMVRPPAPAGRGASDILGPVVTPVGGPGGKSGGAPILGGASQYSRTVGDYFYPALYAGRGALYNDSPGIIGANGLYTNVTYGPRRWVGIGAEPVGPVGIVDPFDPGGRRGMADGGIITSPTRALLGDGGEPEAVVPLSKAREMGFGGGGAINLGGIVVQGNVDSPETANELGRQFSRRARLLLQRV